MMINTFVDLKKVSENTYFAKKLAIYRYTCIDITAIDFLEKKMKPLTIIIGVYT